VATPRGHSNVRLAGLGNRVTICDLAMQLRVQAAVRIQALVRGALVRRRFCALIRYRASLHNTVAKIQALVRAFLARRRARKLQDVAAAIFIQRVWRGRCGRRIALDFRSAKEQVDHMLRCVVKIQGCARMLHARRLKESRRRVHESCTAAVLEIQQWAKVFLARTELRKLQLVDEPIQGLLAHSSDGHGNKVLPWAWQMWAAPWEHGGSPDGLERLSFVDLFWRAGLDRLRDVAATRLEAAARGMISRRRCALHRRGTAATKLQAITRGMILRRHLHCCDVAAKQLQAAVRSVMSRRRFARHWSIGRHIVDEAVGEAVDMHRLRALSSTRIQSVVRMRLVLKKRLLDQLSHEWVSHCAQQIETVQTHLSRFLAQAWLEAALLMERKNKAATVVQSWWRGWIARWTLVQLAEEALWPLKGWFEYNAMGRDVVHVVVRFIPNPNFDCLRHFAQCSSTRAADEPFIKETFATNAHKDRDADESQCPSADMPLGREIYSLSCYGGARPRTAVTCSMLAPSSLTTDWSLTCDDSPSSLDALSATQLMWRAPRPSTQKSLHASPIPSPHGGGVAPVSRGSGCSEVLTHRTEHASMTGVATSETSSASQSPLGGVGAASPLTTQLVDDLSPSRYCSAHQKKNRQLLGTRMRMPAHRETDDNHRGQKFLLEAPRQWRGVQFESHQPDSNGHDTKTSQCAQPRPPTRSSTVPPPPSAGVRSIRDMGATARASALRQSRSTGALESRKPLYSAARTKSGKTFTRQPAASSEDFSEAEIQQLAEDFEHARKTAELSRKQQRRRAMRMDAVRQGAELEGMKNEAKQRKKKEEVLGVYAPRLRRCESESRSPLRARVHLEAIYRGTSLPPGTTRDVANRVASTSPYGPAPRLNNFMTERLLMRRPVPIGALPSPQCCARRRIGGFTTGYDRGVERAVCSSVTSPVRTRQRPPF